ncbi:hypothetical protein DDB_G0282327 [Dictyostelium discoideum AX4]|uniref:Uncharacterized protein n=1 Tax=Dictyostelium discoideum TaxID=44689 RepID=Q54SP0_DICDI|nr:hypothetical protein DDB_G0282327 [Dictyostelium discoideum AX4]EAL66285.1 hypothetical protein DDB_G0282327 [Dictyostelium discoideum AX4]|eukprot:XP_640261.1 hypothetical protein DDB_G0282327 [Dictyostelium discoideum AX4]
MSVLKNITSLSTFSKSLNLKKQISVDFSNNNSLQSFNNYSRWSPNYTIIGYCCKNIIAA